MSAYYFSFHCLPLPLPPARPEDAYRKYAQDVWLKWGEARIITHEVLPVVGDEEGAIAKALKEMSTIKEEDVVREMRVALKERGISTEANTEAELSVLLKNSVLQDAVATKGPVVGPLSDEEMEELRRVYAVAAKIGEIPKAAEKLREAVKMLSDV